MPNTCGDPLQYAKNLASLCSSSQVSVPGHALVYKDRHFDSDMQNVYGNHRQCMEDEFGDKYAKCKDVRNAQWNDFKHCLLDHDDGGYNHRNGTIDCNLANQCFAKHLAPDFGQTLAGFHGSNNMPSSTPTEMAMVADVCSSFDPDRSTVN